MDSEYTLNVFLLGDKGTGKSHFLNNFYKYNKRNATVKKGKCILESVSVKTVSFNFKRGLSVCFWDFDGDSLFNGSQKPPYGASDLCILFYDPRRIITLMALNKFVTECVGNSKDFILLESFGDASNKDKISNANIAYFYREILGMDPQKKGLILYRIVGNADEALVSIKKALKDIWKSYTVHY